MFDNIKTLFSLPKRLKEISQAHIKEMQRIEDSIKFNMADNELRQIRSELIVLTEKVEEIYKILKK